MGGEGGGTLGAPICMRNHTPEKKYLILIG